MTQECCRFHFYNAFCYIDLKLMRGEGVMLWMPLLVVLIAFITYCMNPESMTKIAVF